MKLQPMKGKIFTVRDLYERDGKGEYKGHILFKEPICKVVDIRLAVEWLKEEVRKRKLFLIHPSRANMLDNIIDDAFTDLEA